MTTTEQIQEINGLIDDINARLTRDEKAISDNTFNINKNNNTTKDNVNTINTHINNLHNEDVLIHRELHDLENRLTELISNWDDTTFDHNKLSGIVSDLSETVTDNKNYQDDQNVLLHREIHNLSNNVLEWIDNYDGDLFNIRKYLTQVPQTVLLSESEYERLGTIEAGKYYYVYEED